MSVYELPGITIYYGYGLAGIIDKELFSSPVLLSESNIKLFDPLAVMIAELTVLVAFRICLFVLVPQQLKGDSFPFELCEQIVH